MTTTAALTDEERRARQESRFTWYGLLADDNVQHIADRIQNLLGGRRYTFASINSAHAAFTAPEVRTSQELRPSDHIRRVSPAVHRIGDNQEFGGGPSTSCGITVCDTYGVWGIHSPHATQADARADREAGKKTWTYVVIDGGRTPEDVSRKGITIQHFNGPGETLHWTITAEAPAISLEDAVYELERHERIATTPAAKVTDRDRAWYLAHPLTDVRLGSYADAVPALLGWLRGGANR